MFEIQFFTTMHSQLGIMTWPLTLLSALVMMLIIERLIFIACNTKTHSKCLRKEVYSLSLANEADLAAFVEQHCQDKSTLSQGFCMLINHRKFNKSLREDAVSIWLQKKRRQFTSGLKLLNVIGVLSPLIGLLGTVIGLIEMFKGLSMTQGGVTPAVLADGLGLAMSTTAAGLLIALPAIASSQLFHLWADRILARIEYVLNHFNLHISGVSFDESIKCCAKGCQQDCNNLPLKQQHLTEEAA